MSEETKVNDNVSIPSSVLMKMTGVGIFKTRWIDKTEVTLEGFCDNMFFTVKCYDPNITKKISEFNPLDGRFKLEEATFFFDGYRQEFGKDKIALILKEIKGRILPNPKKEKRA